MQHRIVSPLVSRVANRLLWGVCLLLGCLWLISCASMNEAECKSADWHRLGTQDGAKGVGEKRLSDYASDCAKVGITADTKEYRRGWDSGVKLFCTVPNGWQLGVSGVSVDANVCAGQPTFNSFVSYLRAGQAVYYTRDRIYRNEREIGELSHRIDHLRDPESRRHAIEEASERLARVHEKKRLIEEIKAGSAKPEEKKRLVEQITVEIDRAKHQSREAAEVMVNAERQQQEQRLMGEIQELTQRQFQLRQDLQRQEAQAPR